jgi:lysozyme family protein
MSSFDDAFTELIGNEGGYSNNPADPGGETMWGVTARVAREWGYAGAMKDLLLDTAKQIAKVKYWDPYLCDQLEPHVAFQVLDASYNGGEPAQWLQQAVGAVVDGSVGAKTIAAARLTDPDKIIMRFDAYRLKWLGTRKIWPDFGHGWANRIADNLLRGAA